MREYLGHVDAMAHLELVIERFIRRCEDRQLETHEREHEKRAIIRGQQSAAEQIQERVYIYFESISPYPHIAMQVLAEVLRTDSAENFSRLDEPGPETKYLYYRRKAHLLRYVASWVELIRKRYVVATQATAPQV